MEKQNYFIAGTIAFLITAIILVSIFIQASAQEEKSRQEQAYQTAEKEYRNELRNFLNQSGYCNSGINMTRVVNVETAPQDRKKVAETRVYTVLIYHPKISQLEQKEILKLMTDIVKIAIPIDDCTVSCEFMVSDFV